MEKIAWVTDPHLDHCGSDVLNEFFAKLGAMNPDIVLLGGDFAQGDTFDYYVDLWSSNVSVPTYFVLGNHDFYFSSIKEVRDKSIALKGIKYLGIGTIVPIDDDTSLIGHDVWYDVRNGNTRSNFEMTDFSVIRDLKHLHPKSLLFNKIKDLGDESAWYFSNILPKVFADYNNVIVLTHVPPFEEACMYRGRPTAPDTLPFFSCQIVGKVLKDTMTSNPDKKMLVLSGHTHDEAKSVILPNLSIRVGRAFYGQPRFEILNPILF